MKEKCIVLVDDEAIILMALKMECKKRYKQTDIITALNAEQALQYIEQNKKGQDYIVISDYQLPGMKGDAFLRRIMQEYPGSVMILLTGQAPDLTIQSMKNELSLKACLHKPWRVNDLYEVLDPFLLHQT